MWNVRFRTYVKQAESDRHIAAIRFELRSPLRRLLFEKASPMSPPLGAGDESDEDLWQRKGGILLKP